MKRSPISPMSAQRRAELAADGVTNPFSTFINTGSGLSRTACDRDRKPAPGKRPTFAGPTSETVALLFRRDHGRCARCGELIAGERGRDWSVQHRRARQGTDRRPDTNQPQNLVLLGGSATTGCHGHVERFRAEAREFGWAIRQTDDPAVMPVLHAAHGWVLLNPAGGIQTYSPNHTPTNSTMEVPA